jgi:hypothetical protein
MDEDMPIDLRTDDWEARRREIWLIVAALSGARGSGGSFGGAMMGDERRNRCEMWEFGYNVAISSRINTEYSRR